MKRQEVLFPPIALRMMGWSDVRTSLQMYFQSSGGRPSREKGMAVGELCIHGKNLVGISFFQLRFGKQFNMIRNLI